ncbi:MAG: hypothetical protein HOP28_10125, partial [Gemmatimonadales bacterium]|nr:hypothetical protein [Gemmatimonadales bacterium]
MRFRTVLAALSAFVLSLGCSPKDGGIVDILIVASVEVTPGIQDVILGNTLQLTAVAKTASGVAVPGKTVAWSTTNGSIASVGNTGLVTGLAIGGPVRIRATVDGVVGDALISVRPVPVDRITVSPSEAPVLVGQGVPFTATAFDAGGNVLPGRTFFWDSEHPEIAAVTTTGIVIGLTPGGPVAITAAAEGKVGTASVSVSNRPATRLAFQQQPTTTIAGQPFNPSVKVALQDDLLATVLGATNPVTISLAGNPGNALLSGQTTVNGINGVVTFNNLTLDKAANGYTFLVTSPGLVSATSTPFNIGAGSGNRLAFTTLPPVTAQSGVTLAPQPVLQLRDDAGNPVTTAGVVVTATIAGGAGPVEPTEPLISPAGTVGGTATATTNASGVATFTNLSISGTVGEYTLSFGAPNVTSITSAPIALSAGPAAALALIVPPSSGAQSGVPLTLQPTIQLRDAAGNQVTQAGAVITAALATGAGTLTGTPTATTNAAGQATFTSLAISGPSGSYTIRFSATGLTPVTSGTIVLGAGAPVKLGIVTQPAGAAASDVPLAPQPVVRLLDGSNNPVNVPGVQINVAVSAGALLQGTAAVFTDANGVATFSGIALRALAGAYTLTFSGAGLTSVTSGPIQITAGGATQLSITTAPSAAASSGIVLAQQPTIQVRDAAGNPVLTAGVLVSAALVSGPPGGVLNGTLTVSTTALGLATFTNLAITGAIGAYTIRFTTATGLTAVTSGPVTLGAGSPTKLTITAQPSAAAQSGVTFPQQPALQLRDASDNPVAQAGVVVTAAIATGGGTLGGTLTAVTNASGLATFANLSVSGTIGARTLTFSAPSLTAVISGTVTIAAGPASQLTITTQPSAAAQSGVAFAQQPVLQLRDAAGNAVSSAGVNVTAGIATGGGTLGGTATVATDAAGIATFTNLAITGTAGDRTLSFISGSLTGATSGVVTVTAGAASLLSITTQPSPAAQNAVVFAQQPVIQLRDASNNPVALAGVIVTAAISSGGGTLGGTATATTNGSGVATFTNLVITGTIGTRTLLFTATGYTSVTSGNVVLSAGTATQLAITTQPSASAGSGIAFAQQPSLQLRDVSGNAVSQAAVTVTAAIATGGGTLGGTLTAATNASGLATFANLAISGTIGIRTLTFTSAPLTAATSANITITPGPASQLTITTQPSPAPQSGVTFPVQPVIQLRDAANNAVSQAGIVVTAVIASGGGTLGGTLTANTNASGVATFSTLAISGTIGNRTLSFSAPSLTSVVSGTIALAPGPATQFTITTQPSTTAQSGVVLVQQPILQLRDAAGNAVSSSGVPVTASLASGGGTLGGLVSVTTDVAGVATFSNLAISGTAGDRTLGFNSAGLSPATSGVITVTAGAASLLSITTQPSANAQSGIAFPQQPVIQLRDASNNPVAQAGVIVTAAISTGGGTLGGTTTATTNASGVATFTNLSIGGTIGGRTLLFSAAGFTSVTSATVTIAAGTATQITVTTEPSSSAQSGVAFPQQPVLQLRDASGNAVSQAGVIVTAAIASGGGTLGGTATATTGAGGAASFTNLAISGTIGNRTLGFTAPSLASATSGTIGLVAGPASQLSITTQPSTTAQSGTP